MINHKISLFIFLVVVLAGLVCQQSEVFAFQAVEPQLKPESPKAEQIQAHLKRIVVESQKNFLQTQLAETEGALESLTEEQKAIQVRLSAYKISEASFVDVMRLLQMQRVELAIDLAGLDAKKEALTTAAKSGNGGSAKSNTIPLLEKYVANQKLITDQVESLYKKGSASVVQVQQAKQLLIQAELQFAEAKQAESNTSSPSAAVGDLTATELERVEKKARLAMVEKLLDQYVDARPYVDRVSRLDRDVESQETQKRLLQSRLLEMEEELNELQLLMRSAAGDEH